MTKIRHLEPYGFNEQPQFNGLANTVKANIENIKEKNQEQDKKDESQDENIKQAIDKSVVSLEMLSTPTEGSNRTYAVKQGGNEIGKIEIPFSSLVKSTTYDAEKNLLIFTIDHDKEIKVNLTDLIEDADLVQRRIFDDFKNEVNSFSSNTTDSISELVQKLGSGFTGANTVTSVIERNEKVVSSSLNDLNDRKLDASAYTPTDLSDYYKKEETSGKTDLDTAFNSKANKTDLDTHISDKIKHITADERTKWDNATDTLATHTGDSTIHISADERTKWDNATDTLATHTGDSAIHITSDERTKWDGKISNAQYNSSDKKIYFYSGATTESPVANIDATDFIKDGMVSNVEIKDVENSGSCLVITFNADAGKQDINIPISTIFNPTNYYLKTETSGSTELNTAFGLKANQSDFTAHTGNNGIHITADERSKWNNAAASSHTHTNKAILDTITTIDTELNENSKNLVENSAITKVILENEKIVSASLNDLNDRKLDASAYTKTDLSDYYKKEETSGKTDLDAAFNKKANSTDLATKANQSDFTAHISDNIKHITSDERTNWNNAATNSHTHANKDVLDKITTIDSELSDASNNLVVNSAITKVIVDNEKVVSAALNDLNDRKLDSSAYTPTDLSDYYKKEETSAKTELTTAFNLKANSADLTAHTGNSAIHITSDERTKWNGKLSNAQYSKADKKIYFYSGSTTETPVLNIDATDFIKDGMVSKVEIKDVENSGSCLVITFNADAGSQVITIPVSKIFDSGKYYLKTETSGKTEISGALALKADTSALTAHTGNNDIHITTAERTKWNNADANSHTHANKDVLDKITAIDTELSKTSNNLVVNSAITKVILENEKIVSASLNDLNDRKLDASAYTKTDLSDYYKKEETSGKSEIDTALAAKSNTGHKHQSSDISDIVTGITASNSGSTSVPTVNAVMQLINAKLDINYTGFTGTTLTGVTTIVEAIQKIADKLDKLPNS